MMAQGGYDNAIEEFLFRERPGEEGSFRRLIQRAVNRHEPSKLAVWWASVAFTAAVALSVNTQNEATPRAWDFWKVRDEKVDGLDMTTLRGRGKTHELLSRAEERGDTEKAESIRRELEGTVDAFSEAYPR